MNVKMKKNVLLIIFVFAVLGGMFFFLWKNIE